LTAQAYGRGDESECNRLLVQAFWIDAADAFWSRSLPRFDPVIAPVWYAGGPLVKPAVAFCMQLCGPPVPPLFTGTLRRYFRNRLIAFYSL